MAAPFAGAQCQEDAIILVAHPAFRDLEYRQTVLLAAPAPNGGHVGVILNRPTRALARQPVPRARAVQESGRAGVLRRAVLARRPGGAGARRPGARARGSVPLMKNLYLAFRANTIDHVIETTPNEARYFVGYVGWRPGELKSEIDRGLWSVMNADLDTIFRKDTESLWEELLQQSKRIRRSRRRSCRALGPERRMSPCC